MGSNEEGKSTKSDKPSSAVPEQSNVHVYHPDWAAMQAYYGHRVAIPQYYNSNMAPGHAPPPYMWGPPSPMMAPYGTPYPAFCPPGGVYSHPGVQMGSQTQGHVSQATPAATTTPLNTDTPAKSPGNTDHGFMKKLKEFDGLAMSIGNSKAGSADHSSEPRTSQSSGNEGSSNGSDGNTTGGEQSRKKKSRKRSPTTDIRKSSQTRPISDENEKLALAVVPLVMPTTMDLQNSSGANGVLQAGHAVSPEVWYQNEKELKREKRKQSNRESARRSRLRKQAETEELSVKVDSLVAENMTLRSKLSQLNDKSDKLRHENEALLDQLKAAQAQASGKTENLISRVDKNNAGSVGSSSVSKHQLLNASPRTDLVAAS